MVGLGTARTEVDLHDTMDHGGYAGVAVGGRLSLAAAEDVAGNAAGEDVDGGGVDRVDGAGHIAAVGVDGAEGRTAVDVAIDGRVVGAVVVAHHHGDIAVDFGLRTEAAAEDVGHGVGRGANLAALELYFGVAGDGAAGVAAAVDAGGDVAVADDDEGVAVDAGLVAATIDVDHGAAGDHDIAAAHGGLVAAAEDVGRCAAGDVHVGSAVIVGLVAAAEDPRGCAGDDIHHNGALRGAVKVVAAVDVGHGAAVDSDGDGPPHVGRNVAGAVDTVFLTQSAAIEGAADGAGVEGDSRGGGTFAGCTCIGAVGLALGRAAVDAAVDAGSAGTAVGADDHLDIAFHAGVLTKAAAEDHVGIGRAADTHGAAGDADVGRAGDHTAGVAAAIDTADDGAAEDIDMGDGSGSAYAGLVAAAEDIAADGATVDIDCGAVGRIDCQVAATKDIIGHGATGDVDKDGAQRGAIEVVAAEDIAAVQLRVVAGISPDLSALDGDRDGSPDVSRDIAGAVDAVLLAKAAAIDVAIDIARCQGDVGLGVGFVGCSGGIAVGLAFCRAAIDIAVDIDLRTMDEDFDIAVHAGELTKAATEDAFGSGGGATDGAGGEVDAGLADDGAAGVAAAIDTGEDVAALDVDMGDGGRGTHAGLVAAAEDIAADGAVVDIHHGAVGRIESQVAAAIDVVVDGAAVDVDQDGALRGAIEVVAAEDIVDRAAVDGDHNGAVDLGLDGLIDIVSVGIVLPTQATAIDGTIDGTFVEGDVGVVGGVDGVVLLAGAAHAAEGRAAVHVAPDGGGGAAAGIADGDSDIASGLCGLTEAAAEDTIGMVELGAYGAAVDGHGDVAGNGATGVAAAIDAVGDVAVADGDGGGAVDAGQVAAAIDIDDGAAVHDNIALVDSGLVATAEDFGGITVVLLHRHLCAAHDIGRVAAAVDAACDMCLVVTNLDRGGIVHAGNGSHGGRIVADIDFGVGVHDGRGTLAAAIDVAVHAKGVVAAILEPRMHQVDGGGDRLGVPLVVENIGVVWCQVTGAVDVGDIEAAFLGLMVENVDGYTAGDIAVDIRATKGVDYGAAVEVEGDIAIDVGGDAASVFRVVVYQHTFRAAIDLGEVTTINVECDIAVDDVGLVGAAIQLLDMVNTAAHGELNVAVGHSLVGAAEEGDDVLFVGCTARTVFEDREVLGAVDNVTGRVGTCEGGAEIAAVDDGIGVAIDVGRTEMSAFGIGGSVSVVDGVASSKGVTVAAAEEGVDAATVDGDIDIAQDEVGAHVGSTAAAVDHLHGVVAVVDIDAGGISLGGSGDIVGFVATAVDALDGEGRRRIGGIVLEIGEVGEVANLVGSGVCRFPDVDLYIGFGSSLDVVATEDIAAQDGRAIGFAERGIATGNAFGGGADIDMDAAIHGGGFLFKGRGDDLARHRVDNGCGCRLSTATAIHIALHRAAEDVDLRRVGGCGAHVGQIAAAIHVAVNHDMCMCSTAKNEHQSCHSSRG